MIICVGEILADMTGRTCHGHMEFTCFAGGAPFNVACCLKKLGAACGFCGSVGQDAIGNFLVDVAQKQQFDYLYLQREEERNTTLAFVEVDGAGERTFSFYRKNTADAYLPQAEISRIVRLADIVHIGSLPLSSTHGREFADELIACTHACGKKVSFDVNYRSDIFSCEEEAVWLYRKYIEAADIVKFSEEELPMFAEGASQEERLRKVAGAHKTVLLTLGSRGSMLCAAGNIYCTPAATVQEIEDTNGAGDAFMAGVLASIDGGQADPNVVLRMGNACGALAVSQKGAYPEWGKEDAAALTKELDA